MGLLPRLEVVKLHPAKALNRDCLIGTQTEPFAGANCELSGSYLCTQRKERETDKTLKEHFQRTLQN